MVNGGNILVAFSEGDLGSFIPESCIRRLGLTIWNSSKSRPNVIQKVSKSHLEITQESSKSHPKRI